MTKDEAFQRFIQLGPDVWRNFEFVAHRITLGTNSPKGDVLASILCDGTQRAVGGSLLKASRFYTLLLSDRLLSQSPAYIDGILKHELLHLGYHQHSADFIRRATQLGAPISEHAAGGGKVKLEIKDGTRYKTYREFDTMDEATTFGRRELRDPNSPLYKQKVRVKGSVRVAGKYDDIDFKPPKSVADAAKRGLALRREHGRGGTEVGIARARDLSNRKTLSPSTLKRMFSFFSRHASDRKKGWANEPTNGYIAHMLWGGDPGFAWARKVVRQMESRDKKKDASAVLTRTASVLMRLASSSGYRDLELRIFERWPQIESEILIQLHELSHLIVHFRGDVSALEAFLDAHVDTSMTTFNDIVDRLCVGDRNGDIVLNPKKAHDIAEMNAIAVEYLILGNIGVSDLDLRTSIRQLNYPTGITVESYRSEIIRRSKMQHIRMYARKLQSLLTRVSRNKTAPVLRVLSAVAPGTHTVYPDKASSALQPGGWILDDTSAKILNLSNGKRITVPATSGTHRMLLKDLDGIIATPLSKENLENIEAALLDGVQLPPIVIQVSKDGRVHLLDGNHRLTVYREIGMPYVDTVWHIRK